jgi:dTDP-4-dehydrorhamnose 3,5-epimerase
MINVIETGIPDLYVIEPKAFGDHRGWFMESWSKRDFEAAGLFYDWVQDNHSYSAKRGTLRGIHFQKGAMSQAKLVRCTRGAVLDVAVDLRSGSPAWGKWHSVELSAENKRQFLIPRGFGHAFATLTDDVEFLYKADNPYCPAAEGCIVWNDPDLNIDWRGVAEPVINARDAAAPRLRDVGDLGFVYHHD